MAPLPPPVGPPGGRERNHHHHHRRRAHGLYFHSSPPKVLQMNNHLATKENDYRSRDAIKPSSIRIWLHHKQMSKLAKVLWAGQGMRLRTETSHHPRMKRFLECVPHVMGVIKDIHQAVIDNDLDTLKEKTSPPAPRVILTSKDANGLTPLHKAAGLAHTHIVEYILSVWPSLSSDEDHTGKTPLHWAASAKNNARSFNLLVQAGADETALDDRHKPAEYYKNKPADIDRSLLTVIPEAPRISQQGFPAYFDWAMFTLPDDSDEGSQPTRMKPFLSQHNLLDADAPAGVATGGAGESVSKSKSVHNLTNGVLTELGQERAGTGGSEREDVAEKNGEKDVQQAATDGVHDREDTPTVEQDETVVEHGTNTPTAGDGTDAPDVSHETVNGDSVSQDAPVTPQTDPDAGSVGDVANEADRSLTPVSADVEASRVDSGVRADREAASRNVSAKEQSIEPDTKASKDELADPSAESPGPNEDAEVSKDSLEQVTAKDEEIDQDSLGKDLEPEEAERDSNAERTASALSVPTSGKIGSQAQSRAATGKSIKSVGSVAPEQEQGAIESQTSRQASAAVVPNGVEEARPDSRATNEALELQETLEPSDDRESATSASSARQNERKSGFRTQPSSAKEPVTPTTRPPSHADVEMDPISRQASSTVTTGRASGKSVESSATNRRASIGSRKSMKSASLAATDSQEQTDTGPRHDENDDDSEGNDDSNNADVQIASYRTPAEQTPSARKKRSPDPTEDEQPKLTPVNEPDGEPSGDGTPAESDPPDQQPVESLPVDEPTPEPSNQVLEIEGTVEGEPDQGQLQSQNQAPVQLEEPPNMQQTVQDAIDSADLEQLATIVLNGEGKQLIGRKSGQSEIQAFLDNVPAYMAKIRRVHLAAREGSLRDLQSALDRRKFATAKDEISPHGATPLHVATVFGHAGIVRYLAGRFPETLGAIDDDGRTPLHYAATLKDNGHFYNLLTHLGANPKVEDNLNRSAEYYLGHVQSQGVLSHRQLLRDYGAKEELADEMLNDQELGEQQVEIPLFRTEEGRYLATSLGDPLIKGLTEVANKRPPDPITYLANYLFNFANQKTKPSRKESSENDSNNNFIEGSVNQPAEKELESSGKQTPANIAATVQPTMEPIAVKDESQPSPDEPDLIPAPSDDRDEHGQSMLHFACARSHGRNALIQLIEESGTNITYRDELYRTARDVALQATQPDNAKEIDRYIIGLVAKGDLEALNGMLLEGYDHIVDVVAPDGTPIEQVASSRGHQDIVRFLEEVRAFEENRENLISAIRQKQFEAVVNLSKLPDGAKLVRAKNYYGRCSLHIAILMENEDIVDYLAYNFKGALKIGDNLDRTPLHYAMGVSNVEALSRILIKNGAKRVVKDLKGRQPSYYFMNKADILRLQEEEKE